VKHLTPVISLGDRNRVDTLFFELASESRLGILHELQKEQLKMQEVARRLDLTSTEVFRQLNRLSEASLIKRQPGGQYAITSYGKLVLHLGAGHAFAFRHKEYLLTHDIWRLPGEFVSRIGDLSRADLVLDTIANLDRGQKLFVEAEQFGWGIVESDSPELMKGAMDERVQKGIDFRFLMSQRSLLKNTAPPGIANLQTKEIPEVPVVLGLTERGAVVCFRFLDGRMDYAGFSGNDLLFLAWARDLFLHYWEEAR
jgi:predicted transcriptional regulator